MVLGKRQGSTDGDINKNEKSQDDNDASDNNEEKGDSNDKKGWVDKQY